ncbi:MAG: hypothetical protein P1V51_05700 [Deltaproteobacteria bacterium]|nr:hypothetical protein [Deltaproteobacteria bacterium]
MKRILIALLAVSTLTLAAGCSRRHVGIPGAAIPFAKADYTVLANVNAEECGTYIFGIDWAHLFSNEAASITAGQSSSPFAIIGALLGGGMSAEGSRALYMALDKIPEATHLLSPRVHTSANGLLFGSMPIFGTRCSIVDARGVRIGEKPIPASQLQ